MNLEEVGIGLVILGVVGGLGFWAVNGISKIPSPAQLQADARAAAWTEACHDEARLLATTAGSPDKFECPNKLHRMRVQVASKATNEEAAALVFCECQRPELAGK